MRAIDLATAITIVDRHTRATLPSTAGAAMSPAAVAGRCRVYTQRLYADSRCSTPPTALRGIPSTGSAPRSDKGPGNPNQDPDPPRNGRPDTH